MAATADTPGRTQVRVTDAHKDWEEAPAEAAAACAVMATTEAVTTADQAPNRFATPVWRI